MGSKHIVDLTYPIREDMMVYPGLPLPDFQWLAVPGVDGNYTSQLTIAAHVGTHIDSPKHFIPDGKSLNELDLDRFVGEALLVDVDAGSDKRIELEDLKAALDEAGEHIREGDILLVNTGIYHKFGDPEFARNFPVPTQETIEYVVDQGIKCYGTDASAIDVFGSEEGPNHHIMLGAGVPIVENLTNLDEVGERRFQFLALPLRIERAEGSPCRAIALV